jgi:hypothetical protein
MTATVGAASSARSTICVGSTAFPSEGAEYFLQEAMPHRRFALVYFNDHCCQSFAEPRSIIANARALALREPERERAAAAVERWLLAELEMDRAASAAAGDNSVTLSYVRAPPERIAA